MGTFIKILLILIIPISVNAQQVNPDSLKQALTHAATDSARFIISDILINYYQENNRDSALHYAEKALLIARKNNKQLDEAISLDHKGYVLMHLGKLPESYQCFPPALKIAEDPESENKTWRRDTIFTPRKYRLFVLENIHHEFGHLIGAIGKTDQQIIQYEETKKIAEESGDTIILGFVNMNLGNVYFDLGKSDSALVMEENAARIFIQTGDKRYLSHVYYLIGGLYLQKQNKNLAVQYFHKAVQSAIEQNNISVLSDSYSSLSDFYQKEKNKDSSLYYARKNLSILQSMGSKDLGSAYSNLSISYELNNKIDSAYKYKSLALISTDSTDKARIESLTKAQNLSFDEQLKLEELEKEKADTKNKIRTYAMLAGIGFLVMIAFLLYRNSLNRKKSNVALQKQKEEIQSALSELKATQSQLIQSEKMASLGELTAGIAHEIQNPLNFVNNFSEINKELVDELQSELKSGNTEEAIAISNDIKDNEEKINHHGKRADAIVKGMLQHSRSSTGIKEPTNINALADEYLRLAYHGLRAKDKGFNATLKTDFDESIDKINIVPQDIGRIFLNLYNNSFYAVAEKKKQQAENYEPSILVSTRKVENKIYIHVKDNGNGIPQKVIDKIFQPFFTTKPTGQGTGLGLSLSYDIVKAHGGEIKVETKEGQGSEFTIQLPLIKA
jgi:two-component system, NtrC family, sensor kinase